MNEIYFHDNYSRLLEFELKQNTDLDLSKQFFLIKMLNTQEKLHTILMDQLYIKDYPFY
jgi:hypothetical protein